jgi:3-deoxy-D-manno-octulosonic-acid transferase
LLKRLGKDVHAVSTHNETIWVHALSVGEVISAIPLVRALKENHPSHDIVFSVTTSQGMEIARKELEREVKAVITLPLDFWWSIRRTASRIRPKFFIVVETDLWPGLLHHLSKKGVKAVLVNGRISPRTLRAYERYSFFVRRMFRPVEQCLMQTDLDTRRLLKVGIEPSKVKTVGNVKFDRHWLGMDEKEYNNLLDILNLKSEDWIWVAGSTHQGEEEIILDVFVRLLSLFPKLRLIIAPRRLERAEDIYRVSQSRGLRTILKTNLTEERGPYNVLVLNTMGELGRIYGIGKISFVGGSLVPTGGHNLLEPASFGCPVLFGPHTHNFVAMAELLIEAGGGKRVENSEDLFRTLKELLSDSEEITLMGQKAKKFVEMNRGALDRVMEHVGRYL